MAAPTWNTAHAFAYGEVQLIGKGVRNKKVKLASLATLPALVANIYSHKPVSYMGGSDYRLITIVNGQFADWAEKPPVTVPVTEPQTFRVPFNQIEEKLLNLFIAEVEAARPD
jgi:hypothetical protein